MENRARALVLSAMDAGWSGPPFDPLELADLLGIPVTPAAGVSDARAVPLGKGQVRIEYNPTRSKGRVRFSIAHEIAHTFFPDCAQNVQYRHRSIEQIDDAWQLEMLCNIGAAELTMPLGSFSKEVRDDLSIEDILNLREKYGVSSEALLIRTAKVADHQWAAFCASAIRQSVSPPKFKLDYVIPSSTWGIVFPEEVEIPINSAVNECTAIGYTAKGKEVWGSGNRRLQVECVGLPPYPGSRVPRVAGLLKKTSRLPRDSATIEFLRGNALEPRGTGKRIVAQIVNDATPNWGGKGFAHAVRRKWPGVQNSFREWASQSITNLKIGNSKCFDAGDNVAVFCMVAQKGYRPSRTPRIRYAALEECLSQLAATAKTLNASVHMPRIGTGYAGGRWSVIEELVRQNLVSDGISVTIYDLPEKLRGLPSAEKDFTLELI